MNDNIAIKLRPNKLIDIIGQSHLIGDNKIITNLVKNNKLYSMILHGNPGVGKTTTALVIINELNKRHRLLNAVINNKKDFDIVLEEAKVYGELILIVDEIHRMNKDKQDILLPALESGLITLIGITSTNPYHTINPAIRSRCQIFKLEELTTNELKQGILKTKDVLEDIQFEEAAIDYIANLSSGDLRFAYNLIEVAYYASSDKNLTLEFIQSINSNPNMVVDKNGDGYYDLLSALQKSIRGSDIDAALYYTARLILRGDLEIIFRRLAVIGYEDIGLANPSIGPKIDACINLCRLTGLPEARIMLSVLVSEMAMSPKSNSAYSAMDSILADIKLSSNHSIPSHITTNSPLYKYPHNYPNHYVKQQYLPNNIKSRTYYKPCLNSKYETNLYNGYKNITK